MREGGEDELVPASCPEEGAEVEHVFGMGLQPEHPVGLEALVDDLTYRTLDGTRAQGEAALLEVRIAHALGVAGKVVSLRRERLRVAAYAEFVDGRD